jgi:hypothetical protein
MVMSALCSTKKEVTVVVDVDALGLGDLTDRYSIVFVGAEIGTLEFHYHHGSMVSAMTDALDSANDLISSIACARLLNPRLAQCAIAYPVHSCLEEHIIARTTDFSGLNTRHYRGVGHNTTPFI